MLYFNSEMEGAPKYANNDQFGNVLKSCLTSGFGEKKPDGKNGQELTFNLGYKVIKNAKYIITDGVSEVITEAENGENNTTVIVLSDISKLNGDITIKVLPAGVQLIENSTDLIFSMFGGFNFIYNKSSGFLSIENEAKEKIDFNYPVEIGNDWTIVADNKAIIIKTIRSYDNANNATIISFSGEGYFLSYNRNSTVLAGKYITQSGVISTNTKVPARVDYLGSMTANDGNIYFSIASLGDIYLPLHGILQCTGDISEFKQDKFLYVGKSIVVLIPTNGNNFTPVILGSNEE